MDISEVKEWAKERFVINREQIDWLIAERDRLTAANIDLTERVLYAERERDEAYEKGAADMKLRIRVVMCEADTPWRSYDEVWHIAQDAIKELPLKEAK